MLPGTSKQFDEEACAVPHSFQLTRNVTCTVLRVVAGGPERESSAFYNDFRTIRVYRSDTVSQIRGEPVQMTRNGEIRDFRETTNLKTQ